MNREIELVNRGRGLQLSTSRITVQDLVPYFQQGCSHAEIQRWLPTLTPEEIAVVERYYQEHKEELDEEDRRIRQRTTERISRQRQRFPERGETAEERSARLKQMLEKHRQEKNGARHPR
jgi:uncharacterized protein (DUF433 family)